MSSDITLRLLNWDFDYKKTPLFYYIKDKVDFAADDDEVRFCPLELDGKIITNENLIYEKIVSFYFSNSGITIKYKIDREDFSNDYYLETIKIQPESIKQIEVTVDHGRFPKNNDDE